MASNRITEGVGKKIVEALKKQSDIEIIPVPEKQFQQTENIQLDYTTPEVEYVNEVDDDLQINAPFETAEQPIYTPNPKPLPQQPQPVFNNIPPQPVNNFSNTINTQSVESLSNELEGFEIPTNVAVLKQLISKLPSGVTKQTGAQIIKQTMEALGISMTSVLQEAQQVQDSLNNSSRDCQATIVEYRRQINLLEKQSQKYQRQYAALNDIISLFIQTNH